jgi:hypothetical protein
MGLDLAVLHEAQAGEQRGHVGGMLLDGLQRFRGERVQQVGVAGSFIEDDVLVVPVLPVKTGALGELPALLGG